MLRLRSISLGLSIGIFPMVMLFLGACGVRQTTNITIPTTVPTILLTTLTPTISPTPTETPQSSPTPAPRTLTICLGAEPDTLFLYGGAMYVKNNVLEAIYDGPVDTISYEYQPVILEKLPSLSDGDAVIQSVSVQEGDIVVEDHGEIIALGTGDLVRPAGCWSSECAVTYDGGPLKMDQLSATFSIKEGVKWSDGTPLTAEDSVFSYQVAQQCQDRFMGACGGLGLVHQDGLTTLERTVSYLALDQGTIRWTGYPGFLDSNYLVNFFHPLPQHQIEALSVEEMFDAEETSRQPMGWGPYKIDRWEFGKEIRLKKNPYYFRASQDFPKFDHLIFRFTGENSPENIASLLSGRCDLVDWDANLSDSSAYLLELDQQGLLQAHLTPSTVWEHADFSIGHADYDNGYQTDDRPDFFGDPRTRQAIAQCIDRQRVVDEVMFGKSLVPDSYLPPEHPLFNSNLPHYEFSPSAGNALLEEVGWLDTDGDPKTPRIAQGIPNVPDGTSLSFAYWTTTATQRQQVATILAESLVQCGVRLNVEYFPAAELFAEPPQGLLFSRRFDMAEFAWLTGVEPLCDLFTTENIPGAPDALWPEGQLRFPQAWGGQNESGYSNPEFDRACYTAQEALPGEPGYREAHLQAQEIFAQDLPVIPLYFRLKVTASRADLCGYESDPTAKSDTWNIEWYDFREECR